MGRKFALIIGNSQYQDPRLAQLVTPQEDVNDLAAILRASDIGGFDEVKTLVNESDANIRLSLEDFFADKLPDDLLVIYFSGHGVRDEQGLLYLAVNNTRANRLRATAIPSEFITKEMDRSRSKRQVLILDCCHSGAFAQGSKAVTGESAGTGPAFEGLGYGRVILTATDATQYAWEGDKVIGQADRSVFTHYLIEGLRTGEADANHDGAITLDEIYDYVYERVVEATPRQTPGKWSYKQQGDIVIAHNPHPTTKAAAPSSEVLNTSRRLAAVRMAQLLVRQGVNPGAVYPLRAAANTIGRNEGLEVTVRDTLISRRHARITLREDRYYIEDLLSANGTFVNGKKLTAAQVLNDGDQISIGDTTLLFQLRGAAPPVLPVNEQTMVAVLAHEAPRGQSTPRDVSAQPTKAMPPVAAPASAPPSAKRASSKWIWIGAAGGIFLFLCALFAVLYSGGFPLTSRPTPTASPTAAGDPTTTVMSTAQSLETITATSTVQPTSEASATPSPTERATSTPSPTQRSTSTTAPTRRPTATRVPPTPVPPTAAPTAVPPTEVPPPPPTKVPTLPPPAVADNAYSVSVCCGPTGTQVSSALDYSIPIDTIDLLQLIFETAGGCSDVQLHIFLDGSEIYTSNFSGPITGNTSTGWLNLGPMSPGSHTLILRPEGRSTGQPGDCNSGTLGGWAGTVQVKTNYYP